MDDNETATPDPAAALVLPDGRAARPTTRTMRCPICGAGADRRVASAGFGFPHDLCGRCGYSYPERTV